MTNINHLNSSFKQFIVYNGNDVIEPLYLVTGYINKFNENKNTITMSLKVKDEKLLKDYNKKWKKN